MKRLVVIDGNAILHRAFHAFPPTLKTRQGEIVNAVYGFTRILLSVIADLKPTYLAVAFDLPEPTFRQKEYLGYHANRPEMDKDLSSQIVRVNEVVRTLNIPIFSKSGFEADDVIGSLATKASKRKLETIIVSGDRDLFQLIGPKVKVYSPSKTFTQPILYDPKKVKEMMGVTPGQIVDYKALVGDTADNYPGVPGIGPKTAVKLLTSFKTLAGIYQNLSKIEPELAEKLKQGKEIAILSQKLARLVTKLPVKLCLGDCLVKNYDYQAVVGLFKLLEFRSLIDKLPGVKKEQSKNIQERLI